MPHNPISRVVYSMLSGNGNLSTAVGGRIYPEARAQGSAGTSIGDLPSIVFSINEDDAINALSGSTHFYAATVEVMVLASTAKTAAEVALLVLTPLHNRKNVSVAGGGSGQSPDTTLVCSSMYQRALTGYLSPQNGENTGVFTHSMLFKMMYRDASATQEA